MHHQITPGAVVLTADQVELRVRALEGNVAVLESFDGSFFGYRHVSSLTPVNPQAGDIECLPPATPTASVPGLAAAAGAGQGAGTHSYLWHQVLLTEPIGQWLCVGGRHGCPWSIKRSDKATMDRVQRRRA